MEAVSAECYVNMRALAPAVSCAGIEHRKLADHETLVRRRVHVVEVALGDILALAIPLVDADPAKRFGAFPGAALKVGADPIWPHAVAHLGHLLDARDAHMPMAAMAQILSHRVCPPLAERVVEKGRAVCDLSCPYPTVALH